MFNNVVDDDDVDLLFEGVERESGVCMCVWVCMSVWVYIGVYVRVCTCECVRVSVWGECV